MTPARWDIVKAIFSSAVDLEPASREAYVREAASGEQLVIDEVLSLLRADSEGTILRNPALSSNWSVTQRTGSLSSHSGPDFQTVSTAAASPGAAERRIFLPIGSPTGWDRKSAPIAC